MGDIFPEGKTDLPVQDFLEWPRARSIIEKKLRETQRVDASINERIISYLTSSVMSGSGKDIVENLQNAHMREIAIAMTKIRSDNALKGITGNALIEQANREVDISEVILSELEPFTLTLMNTDYFRYTIDDLDSVGSPRSRNTTMHLLKKRFLETIGPSGNISDSAKQMFLGQLKKAFKRIHPNHPVHGFIGTMLYEISGDISHFHNPSNWFGFASGIDESFLSNIGDEHTGKRFWFSEVTASRIYHRMHFCENSFLFSKFEGAMNAIDIKGFFGEQREGVMFSDNAGAFSYYEDSCFYAKTQGKSREWLQNQKKSGNTDRYFWPVSYSYGNGSFRNAPGLGGGFRFGVYDSCFYEALWTVFKTQNPLEKTLFGSICSGSSKHSFVHPGADIQPKELRNGSFDHSVIMSGLEKTLVENSLRDCILIASENTPPVGKNMEIPATDPHGNENTALKTSIIIGENCLSEIFARWGLQNTLFLYSAKGATISEKAGKKSIWYFSGLGAKVSDNAGLGAKIIGFSFCGIGAKISDKAFYGAEAFGKIGQDAIISGYPFESCVCLPYGHVFLMIERILEQKVKGLVGSIRSTFMAGNDNIENSILSILFEEGAWNIDISPEIAWRIRKRLHLLLSDSFYETEKERKSKEERKWAISVGDRELIQKHSTQRKDIEWKKILENLLENPEKEAKKLEDFPSKDILENIGNWTMSDQEGNTGVSEEIARHVIGKIQGKMSKISKTVSEEKKLLTLIELIRTIHRIKKDADDALNKSDASYTFQKAQFQMMEEGFWEYELQKFVGKSHATRIRDMHDSTSKRKWFRRS